VIAVPERFKDRVRKAQHDEVLDHFFSEIMVNAIDWKIKHMNKDRARVSKKEFIRTTCSATDTDETKKDSL